MNSNTAPNPAPSTSIPGLLRDLRDESTHLFRQEIALARSELKENITRLAKSAVQVAIGAFVVYAGLIVLLSGLGYLLDVSMVRAGIDPNLALWLAPTIIGAVVLLIGWVLLSRARRNITADDLVPHQTIESLEITKQAVEQKFSHS